MCIRDRPRYPLSGTAVMFSEYAAAVDGIPQELDAMGNDRVLFAASEGGPKGPLMPAQERVSATRHGVTG